MILTLDFETRSRIGISGGAWKYAAHPSTEVVCLGVKVDNQPAKIWWNPKFEMLLDLQSTITTAELLTLLRTAHIIEAHNAEFERAIWTFKMDKMLPPMEKGIYWHCTMAKAAAHGLPLSLEKLCQAMGSPLQKDMKGNLLMKQVCSPDKNGNFVEDREQFERIGLYCMHDVDSQYTVSRMLDDLPPLEQIIYTHTIDMNERGIPVDTQLAENIIRLNDEYAAMLKKEFVELTGVPTPSCLEQFKNWLSTKGVEMVDLTAARVDTALASSAIPEGSPARRSLEIRRELSKSSVQKYQALMDRVESDHRARGLFRYHAASTGRWSGQGFQPHNLPSRNLIPNLSTAVTLLKKPDITVEDIEMLWGSFSHVVSSAIRPTICADEGVEFFCSDFAAIEARVLAWLAGEAWVLEAYRNNEDLYVQAASKIYAKAEGMITKTERLIGKVSVLACGYQGGKDAFIRMGANYGVHVHPEDAQEIVSAWRAANPTIVSWWHELNIAALKAMASPGTQVVARSVTFQLRNKFLMCRLPSGRCLTFPFPVVKNKITPWGEHVPTIFHKTVTNNQWVETDTYGGTLAQNITQATARDIMAEAILRLEKHNFRVILHVHDEILAEVGMAEGRTIEEFDQLLEVCPKWAGGLPLKAEGWHGGRYRK